MKRRIWLTIFLVVFAFGALGAAIVDGYRLRDFADMEAVYKWVDEDAERYGVEVTMPADNGTLDFATACETIAMHMQLRAEREGYRLNVQMNDSKTVRPHAICSTHILGWWVFIEHSTHQAWKAIPSRY